LSDTPEEHNSKIYGLIDHLIANGVTIEAEPVKHGRWIEHEWAEEENRFLISNFECSTCHDWESKTSDFCPNCGADMRGETDANY
jgi:hypothetical protein